MLDVAAARDAVLACSEPLPAERVALIEALGRALARPVVALRTQPAGDNSAMDGYAVRAADVAAATADAPVALVVVGSSEAGRPASVAVEAGQAVRIFTGGLKPAGADAVAVQERCTARPADNCVLVGQAVSVGANIRLAGEEFASGEVVLDAGAVVSPAGVGLLAAAGHAEVEVHRRPRVAILVSGDELVSPGQDLTRAEAVVDSNGPMLNAACRAAGATVVSVAQRSDNLVEIATWLQQAAAEADVILTSGGASVGERDCVARAWDQVGVETHFRQVAMKPGKPVKFGTWGHVLCFALPGNPLASLTGFEQLVAPALDVLAGRGWTPKCRLRAPLSSQQTPNRSRCYLLRAGLSSDAQPVIEVPARQGAAILREAATQAVTAVLEGPGTVAAGWPVVAEAGATALAGRLVRVVGPLPATVSVRGPSKVGKTRLIEQIVASLSRQGVRVGTVKHCHHALELDRRETDSHRHHAAGASRVALVTADQTALFCYDEAQGPADWLEAFSGKVALVLIEGFKEAPLPHLTVGVGETWSLTPVSQSGHAGWSLQRPATADRQLTYPDEHVERLVIWLTELLDQDR